MNDWSEELREAVAYYDSPIGEWERHMPNFGAIVAAARLILEGEKLWWCGRGRPASCYYSQGEDEAHKDCGWRLLIPDPQPATEGL